MAEELLDALLLSARYDTAELKASAADVAATVRRTSAELASATTDATFTVNTQPVIEAFARAREGLRGFIETGTGLEGSMAAIGRSVAVLSDQLGGLDARRFVGGLADELAVAAQGFQANSVEAQRYQQIILALREAERELAATPVGTAAGQLRADSAAAAELATRYEQVRAALLELGSTPPPPPIPPGGGGPGGPNGPNLTAIRAAFAETTAEAIRAADIVRTEFDQAISAARLGPEWSAASRSAVSQMEAGLLADLGNIRDLIAADLVPDAATVRVMIDRVLEQFSVAVAAKQAEIRPIQIRAIGTGPADAGVITPAEFAASEAAWNEMMTAENGAARAARSAVDAWQAARAELAATTNAFLGGRASAGEYATALAQAATAENELVTASRAVTESALAQARAVAAAAAAAGGAAGAGPVGAAALGDAAAAEAIALAVAEGRVASGSERMTAGFAGATRQARILAAAEEAVASGGGRMTAGLNAAGAAAAAEVAEVERAAAGVDRLGRSHESILRHGAGGARALHTVANAATVLGAEALHAEGPLLRLAEGIVLFSGGIGGILAVGAALAVVGLTIEHVTEKAREEAKATAEATKALEELKRRAADPVEVRLAEAGTIGRRIDELGEKLTKLRERQRELESNPIDLGGLAVGAAGAVNDLEKVNTQIRAVEEQIRHLRDIQGVGLFASATEEADRLAAAIRAGVANTQDFARANELIGEFSALAREASRGVRQQTEDQQRANTLIEAEQAPLLRTLAIRERLVAETLRAAGAAGTLSAVQAQIARVPALEALIAQYGELARAAGGDTEQVQRLTDKQADLRLLVTEADRATAAFLNIGGAARAISHDLLPGVRFNVIFDFQDPGEILARTLAEADFDRSGGDAGTVFGQSFIRQADRSIGDNLNLILLDIQRRTDARAFAPILQQLQTPITAITPDAGVQGQAEQAFNRLNASLIGVDRAWTDAVAAADAHLKKLHDNRSAAARLADTMGEIAQAGTGIAEAAANVGLIGAEAAGAISDVLALTDAITNVLASASTGNVLGLIGAGINLVGGLVGPSAAEIERNRILDENNRLMTQNNALLANQAGGVAALGANLLLLATAANARAAAQLLPNTTPGVQPGEVSPRVLAEHAATDAFLRALAESGVSLEDFAAQVEQATGIKILDSEGRLIAQAFDDAADATRAMVVAATTFGNTFNDQRQRLDLLARLQGQAGDATAAFGRELQAISSLSPAVAEAFKNVDLGDPEAVRRAALDLFNKFDSGFFAAHPDLFGKIEEGDFIGFLTDAAGFLEGLGDAASDAANRIGDFNIPEGFRRAALAFEASGTPSAGIPPTITGAGVPLIDPETTRPVTLSLDALRVSTDRLSDQIAATDGARLPDLTVEAGATADSGPLMRSLDSLRDVVDALAGTLATPAPGDRLPGLAEAIAALRGSQAAPAPAAGAAPAGEGVTIQIQVFVNGRASPDEDFRSNVEEAVMAAMQRIGMIQSGNSLQVGLLS